MRRRLFLGLLVLAAVPAAAEPPRMAPAAEWADRVVIEKAARRLTLWRDGTEMARYPIVLGFSPVGDKTREGDGRTPEGSYRIDRRNPNSAFTLSLGIDYPTPAQRRAARTEGRDPGGDIFIHGQPNGYHGPTLRHDWTAGCAAVSNDHIREIWQRVPIGTEVIIRP